MGKDRALGYSMIKKIIFFMKDFLRGINIMDMEKLLFTKDNLDKV